MINCTNGKQVMIEYINTSSGSELNLIRFAFMCILGLTFEGPILMVVWSEALTLIASYLSPQPEFKSHPGHGIKLSVTLGGSFHQLLVFRFPSLVKSS